MMTRINSITSKNVGWEPRHVSYPKSEDAIKSATNEQVLEWHRFLPSPMDEEQRRLLNAVTTEFADRKTS